MIVQVWTKSEIVFKIPWEPSQICKNVFKMLQSIAKYCVEITFLWKLSKMYSPETIRASLGPTVCMLPIFQMGATAAKYNLTEILSNFQLTKKGCLFRTVGGKFWKFSMQRARRAILLSIDPLLDTYSTNRASISSTVGMKSDGSNISFTITLLDLS